MFHENDSKVIVICCRFLGNVLLTTVQFRRNKGTFVYLIDFKIENPVTED